MQAVALPHPAAATEQLCDKYEPSPTATILMEAAWTSYVH